MSTTTYTLANEQECERLEAQALLDDLDLVVQHLALSKDACVLDAGSGSGAFARAIARREPGTSVIGVDINPEYVAYAEARAAREELANVSFRQGDLRALPFADRTFDVIWTKYVLYFLPEPEPALEEFRRVLRPGGQVVIALNDWSNVAFDPPQPSLKIDVDEALNALGDAGLVVRVPGLLRRLGFVEIKVTLSADPVYSAIAGQSPVQHANLAHNLASGRRHIANAFKSEKRADQVTESWLAFLDRPDALMMVPFWHVSGRLPDP